MSTHEQHSPTAQPIQAEVLKEPPIKIDPRVGDEIRLAHSKGQPGEFRVRVIPDQKGENLQFEFSWDEPERDDFALALANGEQILIDGMTLAFMFDSYDLIWEDNTYSVAKTGTRRRVHLITPDDVNAVERGDMDLTQEVDRIYRSADPNS